VKIINKDIIEDAIRTKTDFIEYINMALSILENLKIYDPNIRSIILEFLEESRGLASDLQNTIDVMNKVIQSDDTEKLRLFLNKDDILPN